MISVHAKGHGSRDSPSKNEDPPLSQAGRGACPPLKKIPLYFGLRGAIHVDGKNVDLPPHPVAR
jgi:hypothetical protein